MGIAWLVALGFVRLWTNGRVFERPMAVDGAAGHVESWMARRIVRIVNPGDAHGQLVFRLIREAGSAGNLTMDAHLAALAIEHRAVIHTADMDFGRFSGVKFLRPLG